MGSSMKQNSIDIIKYMIPFLFNIIGIILIIYPHVYINSFIYQLFPLIGLFAITFLFKHKIKTYLSIVTLIFCLDIRSGINIYLQLFIYDVLMFIAYCINLKIYTHNKE